MAVDILMPQLGQAMVTGLIIAWHVADGAEVRAGAPLLTIESDKSAFEIEAAATGVVDHRMAAGTEADVGAILGTITVVGTHPSPLTDDAPVNLAASIERPAPNINIPDATMASPRARQLAAAENIPLKNVVASRADGMITASDVERAVAARADTSANLSRASTRRPISAGQKSAIRRLQTSWQQAPHIVQMIEIDATALSAAQEAIRNGQLDASLNDVIIQAAADTMAEYRDLNAYIENDTIVENERISVGIAVATGRGLRTPLIDEANGRSLKDISSLSRAAIEAARQGRAVAGRASLTVSNLGRYGVRCGAPVLNLDESVLVFVGEIVNAPVVADGAIVAKPRLTLSIAYDHRIVDGLRAAEFSAALRRRLESFVPSTGPGPSIRQHARAVQMSSSAGMRCDLTDGRHDWTAEEPPTIDAGIGIGTGTDPVALVLSGLLSSVTIGIRKEAEKRKLAIDRLIGSIETQSQGEIKSIRARIEVWSPARAAEIRAMLEPAKAASFVYDMLSPDLDLAIDLSVHTTR
jgi:pyruvate/2-oxoglutarate dehydrogenase complex dihydrolipoamide acyltransferase (E2) component